MTQYRHDEPTLETVTWGSVEPPGLTFDPLWEVTGVLGPSREGVTASLLPVPPPLPEAGTWRGALSRFALVTDMDRCLDLAGRLGRWSWETLLLLACGDRLVLTVCC